MKEEAVISVVAPCYNEEKCLEEFVQRTTSVLSKMKLPFELILINDGSRDKTLELAVTLGKAFPQLKIVDFSRNFGHQIAVTAGVDVARGDAVIIIDADLQDPPEVMEEMIKKWKDGVEVVYGKRNKREGEGFLKLFTAKMFYRMLRAITNMPIPVDTGDFRLIDRKVVDALKLMRERHRYVRGMVCWLGFKHAAVTYSRQARFEGKSNYSYRKMLLLAVDAITSFSVMPLRIIAAFGLIVLVATFCLSTIVIITRIFYPAYFIPGFSALVVIILFLGGMIIFSIGLLGEYISRIFEEVKQRPLYLVREIHEFKKEKE